MSGVGLALSASFAFSVMNALVKAVSARLPTGEVVFFRSLIGVALAVALMRTKGSSFACRNKPLMLARSALGAASLWAMFLALTRIRLADATMLAHLSPVFVVLFAGWTLGETAPRRYPWALALSLAGAALIVKPGGGSLGSPYALLALASAVTAAGASVAIRRLSREHDPNLIILYFLGTAALLSAPATVRSFVPPGPRDALLLGAIGLVSFAGQTFLTLALAREKAGVVDLTRYAGIVFNALWGLALWGERLDAASAAGGALIVGSCLLLRAESRPLAPAPAPRPAAALLR